MKGRGADHNCLTSASNTALGSPGDEAGAPGEEHGRKASSFVMHFRSDSQPGVGLSRTAGQLGGSFRGRSSVLEAPV